MRDLPVLVHPYARVRHKYLNHIAELEIFIIRVPRTNLRAWTQAEVIEVLPLRMPLGVETSAGLLVHTLSTSLKSPHGLEGD